ncbi:MAG: ComF family protein [Methylophilus sp.]|nr:ComF family protein [Methylophilus sp.]
MKSFRAFVLQQQCLLCGEAAPYETAICKPCLSALPWHSTQCCPQCGLMAYGNLCGNCIQHAPYFDQTHALFNYAYPIDRILQSYKYKSALHLSQTLGNLLAEKVKLQQVDTIIAMPLHPERLQERGFNQSLEIAKVVAKYLNSQLDVQHCQRVVNTPPQASLALKDRVRNIKGAFKCLKSYKDQHIAVVDDVMTSGASLNELAKTLKNAGAASVSCWLVARTL